MWELQERAERGVLQPHMLPAREWPALALFCVRHAPAHVLAAFLDAGLAPSDRLVQAALESGRKDTCDVLSMLLTAGAPATGEALRRAVLFGQSRAARMLVEAGAPVDEPNAYGDTVHDWARAVAPRDFFCAFDTRAPLLALLE